MIKYFVYNFNRSARVYSDTNNWEELLKVSKSLVGPSDRWPHVRKGPWDFYYLYVWGKPLETLTQSHYERVRHRKELEADKKEIEFNAYNQRVFRK